MERREAIKYTAMFMGISLSGATISSILSGCAVSDADDWAPSFLSPAEADFVNELAETIMPRTKTPGAKDAKVVRFIDTVRPLRYTMEENEKFKTELTALIEQAKIENGKEFISLSPEKQLEWVSKIDKSAYEYADGEERPFYISLKEQIAAAFFSSEIVMKEFFAFDPIPGGYDACIPYDEVGRAWALG